MTRYFVLFIIPRWIRGFPPFVGIDDFAFKKGHSYGTIICDLVTHRPIDLLPSRETGAVLEWLEQNPHVKLVSRDRFAPYREAISQVSRNITEVLDRFHLLKNLSDLFKKICHTLLPGSFGLKIEECAPVIAVANDAEDDDRWDHPSWHRTLDVKKAYETGESVTSIAYRFSISRQTVYNDLRRTAPISHHRKRLPSASRRKVNRWIDRIRQLDESHATVSSILSSIRRAGYDGSASAVRKVVEEIRRERKETIFSPSETITRQRAFHLLWNWEMDASVRHRKTVDDTLIRFPELRHYFCFVHSFRGCLESGDWTMLQQLVLTEHAKGDRLTFRFTHRLIQEQEAFRHACERKESNGPVEGQVNRLKLIKRIMYGQESFELLKRKVMYQGLV